MKSEKHNMFLVRSLLLNSNVQTWNSVRYSFLSMRDAVVSN